MAKAAFDAIARGEEVMNYLDVRVASVSIAADALKLGCKL